MEKFNKSFSSKPKNFINIGILIIIFSTTLLTNQLINSNYTEVNSIFIILLSYFASGIFIFIGTRKRELLVSDNGIIYISAKFYFDSNWDDIAVIKSFQEIGKTSENLIIIKNDDTLLTISSSFFDKYTLIDSFDFIVNHIKNSKYDNITIEDDLNWLNK